MDTGAVQSPKPIKITADFAPVGTYTGSTLGMIPRSVVRAIAERYNLLRPDARILDPCLGSYTIPEELRRLGAAVVDAGDIMPEHCDRAKIISEQLKADGFGAGRVVRMDLAKPPLDKTYTEIYTSLPFEGANPAWTDGLTSLLKSDGLLIVDSALVAWRHGQQVRIADEQIKYLAPAFALIDAIHFETDHDVAGHDRLFTELIFRHMPNRKRTGSVIGQSKNEKLQ